MRHHFIHPYMPNSVPHIEEEMLRELGLSSVEELYRTVIPEDLLFQGTMDLPAPLLSEQALKRHVNSLLAQNTSTEDAISFLRVVISGISPQSVTKSPTARNSSLPTAAIPTPTTEKCRRSSSTPA